MAAPDAGAYPGRAERSWGGMVEAMDVGCGNGDSVLDAVSKDGSGSSALLFGRESGGFEGAGSMAFKECPAATLRV